MRHFLHRGFLLPCALLLALVSPINADMASDDEKALRHLKTVLWQQAYRTQDVELLAEILHPSFQMIDGEGRRSTRQDELDWVASNRWDPGTFEYRIERLDIYDGEMAVVDGTGLAESYSYKSSNVLIKEDGRWRAVASHVSGYQAVDEE